MCTWALLFVYWPQLWLRAMQCHIPSFSLRAQCASKILNLEALIRIQMHTDYLLTMTEKLILERNCIYWLSFGPEITLDACKVNQNDLPYVSMAFCSSNYATFSYEAVNIPTTTTDQWHFMWFCLEKLKANFIHCVSRVNILNKRKNNGSIIALWQENNVIYCLELMLNCKTTVFWMPHWAKQNQRQKQTRNYPFSWSRRIISDKKPTKQTKPQNQPQKTLTKSSTKRKNYTTCLQKFTYNVCYWFFLLWCTFHFFWVLKNEKEYIQLIKLTINTVLMN